MKQNYDNLISKILMQPDWHDNRTGIRTTSLYGESVYADLSWGFPILWAKTIHWKSVLEELLWFLRGETNVASLKAQGVRIWDEWADEDGHLGRIYGAQWRNWVSPKFVMSYEEGIGRIDQISRVEKSLRSDPFSRRHIVSAWNPGELDQMALPPCHFAFQFCVGTDKKLHCIVSQRSADIFLGLPFNISSYALLTHLFASTTGLKPGSVTINMGDAHLYENHVDQAREYLSRLHGNVPPVPCRLELDVQSSVLDYKSEHIKLIGYKPLGPIKAKVAV